jgi:hypothetical protein
MKTIVKAQSNNDQMLCFDLRAVALSKGVHMELIKVLTVDLELKIYNISVDKYFLFHMQNNCWALKGWIIWKPALGLDPQPLKMRDLIHIRAEINF